MTPLIVDLITIPTRSHDIPSPGCYPIPGGEDGRGRIHAGVTSRGSG